MSAKRAPLLFRVTYRYLWGERHTVVEARDAAEAEATFRAMNPHVEFVSCERAKRS